MGMRQERVGQTEKEKSQLLMQQALITQFMQSGAPGESFQWRPRAALSQAFCILCWTHYCIIACPHTDIVLCTTQYPPNAISRCSSFRGRRASETAGGRAVDSAAAAAAPSAAGASGSTTAR